MSKEQGSESAVSGSQSIKKEEEMAEEKEAPRKLSRRDFVKGAAVGGAGVAAAGVLASCAPAATPAPAETAVPCPTCPPAEECAPCPTPWLPETWDMETDVVVAGSGAGLLAAIEAADAGSEVILLEKAPVLGGESAVCIAWITANSTKAQERAGVTDSPEAHWEKWKEINAASLPLANLELNRLYIDKVGEAVDRLEELGMTFVLKQCFVHEVPRTHLYQPDAGAWATVLGAAATERGVQILTETPAVELIADPERVVLGIKATDSTGATLAIKARKGVVLAAGDISSSTELKSKYVPAEQAEIAGLVDNTGDGLIMAQAIGADTSGLFAFAYVMILTAGLSPTADLLMKGAIYVNKDGERFVDELSPGAAMATVEQPGGNVFVVFGKEVADFTHTTGTNSEDVANYFAGRSFDISLISGVGHGYLEDYQERGLIMEADTIEALADEAGIDPENLKATIDKWNAYVAAKEDEEFGRNLGIETPHGMTAAMKTPPFYAIGPGRVVSLIADGPALVVDSNMQVLDVHGEVIPRLYAAGAGQAGGTRIYCGGHGHHMAFTSVSGMIAGQSAAAEEAWE